MNGELTPRTTPETPFWAHLLPFFAFFFFAHVCEHFSPWHWLAATAAAAAALAWQRPWRDAAVWAHVMPFALWLALMTGLGDPAGWKYAVRTAACAIALAWARPWRWYAPVRLRHVPLALAVGLAVLALWVGLETPWFKSAAPGGAALYERFLVLPLGRLREPLASTPYAPDVTGWTLFAVHMFGTSVVIATIEEFFFRGFFYRWLLGRNFLEVALTKYDATVFFAVAAVFGLEHAEWFAGILCGLAFAWLLRRTGDLWAAVIAHGTTNFLLGLYVLVFRQWHFW